MCSNIFSDRTLVFMDIENIAYGFYNTYGYNINWKALLRQLIERHNPSKIIAFAKFYPSALFPVSGALARFLRARGVIVQSVPLHKNGKEVSDFMIINAMWTEACHKKDNIDRIVLLSGDGDFHMTLVSLQQLFGYHFSIYALDSDLHPSMRNVSDDVILLDSMDKLNKTSSLESFLLNAIADTKDEPSDRWFTFSSLREYAKLRRPEPVAEIEVELDALISSSKLSFGYRIDCCGSMIRRIMPS
jgi:hypothetical protein